MLLMQKGVDISNMTQETIYQYIFSDSFSTKESVSDISGRGVGMSAVKHEIDALGGEIKISSQKNMGTTFEFLVPLQ
jgi:chemotaxis protein histidine kinase CheA